MMCRNELDYSYAVLFVSNSIIGNQSESKSFLKFMSFWYQDCILTTYSFYTIVTGLAISMTVWSCKLSLNNQYQLSQFGCITLGIETQVEANYLASTFYTERSACDMRRYSKNGREYMHDLDQSVSIYWYILSRSCKVMSVS